MSEAKPTDVAEPKPLDEEIEVFGLTDKGKVRKKNEDQFLICSLHKNVRVHATSLPDVEQIADDSERLGSLCMVADGVGGHAAGEEAARIALEAVAGYVMRTMRCYYTADPNHEPTFLETLRQGVFDCHEKVLAAAAEAGREGMATTLTLVMTVWPRAYVVQVGDSRMYLLREGVLRQVTRDQTLAREMADHGAIASDEIDASPLSHVLTSAIGGSEAKPVIGTLDMQRADVMMICSDGLTKHVSDEQIRERLATMDSAQQVCRLLVDDALDAGGSDNVTVVVGRLRSLTSTG